MSEIADRSGGSIGLIRVALAQINPTVGDLDGNEKKILSFIARANELGADLVAFPELAVPGYPPEDLLLKPSFLAANQACLRRIAKATTGIAAIVGYVEWADDLYNAAAVLQDGKVVAVYRKMYLPNYSVFDEERYFRAGQQSLVLSLGEPRGGRVTAPQIGVNICEDIWYPAGPTEIQALAGAHDRQQERDERRLRYPIW
jgi:NAD+ synthase (glutamine-hydrolysing)